MNLMAHARTFFLISGILLIVVAVLQMLNRPRMKERASAMSLLDATTLRAFVFVVFGVMTILVGAGVIPIGPGR
jgi:hypothetical protein